MATRRCAWNASKNACSPGAVGSARPGNASKANVTDERTKRGGMDVGLSSCGDWTRSIRLQNNDYKDVPMLTRRLFMAGTTAAVFAPASSQTRAAPATLTEDGLY